MTTVECPCCQEREPGPALLADAIDAYLRHVRATGAPGSPCAAVLDDLGQTLGRYRVLVDIEDGELAVIAEALWSRSPSVVRRRNLVLVRSWSAWCRAAGLPVPSLPAPSTGDGRTD